MPDKGKIMSQAFYEKQSKLVGLYKEAFVRKEMNVNEATAALKTLGFGKVMAVNKVHEWAVFSGTCEPETEKAVKLRHKQQAMLEMYMLRMEYMRLRTVNRKRKKNNVMEISENDILNELIQAGFKQELVKSLGKGSVKKK